MPFEVTCVAPSASCVMTTLVAVVRQRMTIRRLPERDDRIDTDVHTRVEIAHVVAHVRVNSS